MVVRPSALPAGGSLFAAAASFALVLPHADATSLKSVAGQHSSRSANRLRRLRQPAPGGQEEVYGFAEETAHRVGPGGCFNIWKNSNDRCMVKTKCADQNIADYSFSLVCRDKADGVVRHQFGKDSFDNEETFDTLIICNSCEADAVEEKKLVVNLPLAEDGRGVPLPQDDTKHLSYDVPKKGGQDNRKRLVYDLPERNGTAAPPTLEEEVKDLTIEVRDLQTDMAVAESAVQKLNAKVFAPGAAPCPAPPPAAPAAAPLQPPPAAPVHLRAHRKRHRHEPAQHHHRRQRVVEEDDDEQDDEDAHTDENEVSEQVSEQPPQPPMQAALATDDQQSEDDDEEDQPNKPLVQDKQDFTVRQACYMNLNKLACEGGCVWNAARKACEELNQDDDDPQQATVLVSQDNEEDSDETADDSDDRAAAQESSSQDQDDAEEDREQEDSTQESDNAEAQESSENDEE